MAAAAGVTQSERLHGLAVGMLAHYLRDLGVGSGVPLLWPLTSRSLNVPYARLPGGLRGAAWHGRPRALPDGPAIPLAFEAAYSRSRPLRAAPAHIPGASGRGP